MKNALRLFLFLVLTSLGFFSVAHSEGIALNATCDEYGGITYGTGWQEAYESIQAENKACYARFRREHDSCDDQSCRNMAAREHTSCQKANSDRSISLNEKKRKMAEECRRRAN